MLLWSCFLRRNLRINDVRIENLLKCLKKNNLRFGKWFGHEIFFSVAPAGDESYGRNAAGAAAVILTSKCIRFICVASRQFNKFINCEIYILIFINKCRLEIWISTSNNYLGLRTSRNKRSIWSMIYFLANWLILGWNRPI